MSPFGRKTWEKTVTTGAATQAATIQAAMVQPLGRANPRRGFGSLCAGD